MLAYPPDYPSYPGIRVISLFVLLVVCCQSSVATDHGQKPNNLEPEISDFIRVPL
jgi:hypothetical protein